MMIFQQKGQEKKEFFTSQGQHQKPLIGMTAKQNAAEDFIFQRIRQWR
jgi:hypothetical protein